jgi:hypothetical protein
MYHYRIYDLNLISDLSFPQLISCGTECADVAVTASRVSVQLPPHPSDVSFDCGMDIGWLENQTCSLLVQNGNSIRYELKAGGNEQYLRTYILGWGMSMLAIQRNEVALHCSAISDDAAAILFCGESGSGKSTLTSAYLARGYHLMADDMSFVSYHNETVMAKAAFPYQKLCRDAALRSGHPLDSLIYIDEAKDKYLVPCHEIFDDTSRPVKAIIILGKAPVSQVELHKPEGLDAFHACVNNLFLRHLLKEKKYAPATAGQCLKIASRVPVYVILRPLDADTTGEVIETAFAITSKVR